MCFSDKTNNVSKRYDNDLGGGGVSHKTMQGTKTGIILTKKNLNFFRLKAALVAHNTKGLGT